MKYRPLGGLTREQHDVINHALVPLNGEQIGKHASRHAAGGADALSGLSRSMISDFFNTPFWPNIPDTPTSYPPSAHASTHAADGADAITSALDPRALRYGLQKLAEYTFSTNGSQVTFTGLDIKTHRFYMFVVTAYNPSTTDAVIHCFINGDTTATNYYSQYCCSDATAVSAARENSAAMLNVANGAAMFGVAWLGLDCNGYPRWYGLSAERAVGSIRNITRAGGYIKSVTNITRVDLVTSVAGAFGIGSKIIVYGGSG